MVDTAGELNVIFFTRSSCELPQAYPAHKRRGGLNPTSGEPYNRKARTPGGNLTGTCVGLSTGLWTISTMVSAQDKLKPSILSCLQLSDKK